MRRTRRKSRLCIDSSRARFLGVCAGIADYLNVPTWAVRLGFVVAVCFGFLLIIPAYFIAWLVMDKDSSEKLRDTLKHNPTVEHLRNVDYRKRFYRNPREGKVFGVCAGMADYLEVDVFWVRVVTAIVMISSFFIGLIAYIGAYFLLEPRPEQTKSFFTSSPEYSRFSETLKETRYSRRPDLKSCSRKFAALQERMIRMEAYVTSSRYRTNRAFRQM